MNKASISIDCIFASGAEFHFTYNCLCQEFCLTLEQIVAQQGVMVCGKCLCKHWSKATKEFPLPLCLLIKNFLLDSTVWSQTFDRNEPVSDYKTSHLQTASCPWLYGPLGCTKHRCQSLAPNTHIMFIYFWTLNGWPVNWVSQFKRFKCPKLKVTPATQEVNGRSKIPSTLRGARIMDASGKFSLGFFMEPDQTAQNRCLDILYVNVWNDMSIRERHLQLLSSSLSHVTWNELCKSQTVKWRTKWNLYLIESLWFGALYHKPHNQSVLSTVVKTRTNVVSNLT